jgi:hypothetical protein
MLRRFQIFSPEPARITNVFPLGCLVSAEEEQNGGWTFSAEIDSVSGIEHQ